MLSIRMSNGLALHLDRKVAERNGYGFWSFHQSQSSWALEQGRRTWRCARLKPAEPSPGKQVEVFIVEGPDTPEEAIIGPQHGVVAVM